MGATSVATTTLISVQVPAVLRIMPGRGHRVYATQTVRVSKTIEAPLRYVYDWCTDYRSDDGKFSRQRPRPRFRTVKISPRRVLRIRIAPGEGAEPAIAVDVLQLSPPNAWHTNQIDEQDLQVVDYKLTALSREKTRLDLLVTERYISPKYPSRVETARRVRATWDRLAGFLEERYRSGKPAKG